MRQSTLSRLLIIAGVLLTVGLTACSDDNPAPTEPVDDDPVDVPRVTETFNGSLGLGETSCHDFITVANGNVDMTLTGLEPLTTLTVGLGIGTPDAALETGCAFFAQDNSVRLGNTLQATRLAPSAYCVCVLDVGNIFPDTTVDYALAVIHP